MQQVSWRTLSRSIPLWEYQWQEWAEGQAELQCGCDQGLSNCYERPETGLALQISPSVSQLNQAFDTLYRSLTKKFDLG